MSAIDELNLKFTSGNDVPVSQAVVTRDEWLAVVAEAEQLRAYVVQSRHLLEKWQSLYESAMLLHGVQKRRKERAQKLGIDNQIEGEQ